MTIGNLARRASVRPSAVRYYEARGLIPPSLRLPNGYRVYDDDDLIALRFLRRAQGFGITLREMKQLLEMVRHGRQPCDRVRELATRHLREVETKLCELQGLRKDLKTLLERPIPKSCDRHSGCPLLD
jgi:DNA-binding transcriptional MerR regulator